ncbi:hypothetical protein BST81_07620 [Leptolyngbya sp. 'hensonii']|uniref:DUF4335 domain-containing protein n=1 Tax=Leptolyngbya sp. 'hensonii' TaxID=1922337 RepID=UPI00094FE977|nr:DUF4335 domain-containing protein [Leptolyngbya sp. 'hensonii']OLP19071.1 hypothetical protein BST81_07620 [Leptolyngbya sp. 'hensonii']
MRSAPSTQRRFTAPTCVLEIAGEESPLSRWLGQSALKQLQFRLWLVDPDCPNQQQVILQGDRTELEMLVDQVEAYVQTLLGHSLKPETDLEVIPPAFQASSTGSISLQPRGLLSHELIPGSLAAAESPASIALSAIQLSDLTTVLDLYGLEVKAIPQLGQQRRGVAWLGQWQMAAVALVTVGLTATTLRLMTSSRPPLQTSSAPEAAKLDQPQEIASELDRPLSSPFPSGSAVPASPVKQTAQGATPAPVPSPGAKTPSQLAPAFPPTSPFPVASQPQVAIAPVPASLPSTALPPLTLPPLNQPELKERQGAVPPTGGTSAGQISPAAPPALPPAARDSVDRLARRSELSNAQQAPAASAPIASTTTPDVLGQGNSPRRAAPAAQAGNFSQGRAREENRTAFDTVPQVAEVRQYFQQRWQPPAGLARILEYSLILSPAGKLQRIVPLNQAAIDYFDQAEIPPVGQVLVSPWQDKQTLVIRLVLSPDGKVQAFLE